MSNFSADDFSAGSLSAYVYSLGLPTQMVESCANNIHRLSEKSRIAPAHASELVDMAKKLEAAAQTLRKTAALATPFPKPRLRYLQAAE